MLLICLYIQHNELDEHDVLSMIMPVRVLYTAHKHVAIALPYADCLIALETAAARRGFTSVGELGLSRVRDRERDVLVVSIMLSRSAFTLM